MGKPVAQQNLVTRTPGEVIRIFKQRHRFTPREHFDPGPSGQTSLRQKQIWIVGTMLLGLRDGKTKVEWEDAHQAVYEAAFSESAYLGYLADMGIRGQTDHYGRR